MTSNPLAANWIQVLNTESDPAPPFALLRIVSIDSDGIVSVAKPDTDGQTDLLINWGGTIPANGLGQAHQTFPTVAAYTDANEENAAPAAGEIWGAVADSWYLQKSRPGFLCMSAGSSGLVSVTRQTTALVAFVRITSTTQTDGRYPAKVQMYDPVNKTWSDEEDCWYVDAN